MRKKIKIVIDNAILNEYGDYYFQQHPRAHKHPIPKPYHESINAWMILRRPAMNALKQRWKAFIKWMVEAKGYNNLNINKCEVSQCIYYPTSRRHDIDNGVPKFILDGLVEGGFIIDDSSDHVTKLTLECGVDKENPRTELTVSIIEELKEK